MDGIRLNLRLPLEQRSIGCFDGKKPNAVTGRNIKLACCIDQNDN
jgi:hypothetical protein